MISAPIPKNEQQRLQQLRAYSILDTLPEEDYDHLTEIAASICNVPISLISFIDEDRQWFKSKHGVKVDQINRELAFCAHAITSNEEIFIVQDTREDERFHDNPLVTGNHNVIFYAGVPLINADGYSLGTLCVIDNTPRNLNEQQIKSLSGLAKQIVNLLEFRKKSEQLEKAIKDLHQRNQDLSEFAFIASHDLQEPLRTMYGFIRLIKKKYLPLFDETGKEYLDYISDASLRMRSLVTGLLEYSNIGQKTERRVIDCNLLMCTIQEDLHASILENQATIIFDPLPMVYGVETEVRQLFQNILSNSIKFRRPEVPPYIKISSQKIDDFHQFRFEDNGIGIAPQDHDKIFTVFRRLHPKNKYEGNGLGLALCRRIVETHGGKIWTESNKKEGSTFCLTLPLAPAK